MTVDMESAALPVVSISFKNGNINKLHGYVQSVDLRKFRPSLTPLNGDRHLKMHIRKYGEAVSNLFYEVRSRSGDRLIEKTDIAELSESGDSIDAAITLKDLIDDDTEYFLCVGLTDSRGREVKYYTRIIKNDSLKPDEMTGFVRNFTDCTFNKDRAAAITEYLESDSTGDNTSFSHVNIHSSFDQVTWGELHPELISDLDTTIIEIDSNGGTFSNTYRVEAGTSQGREQYEVEEYFRLRYTEERIYLLEFDRTMKEIFVPDKDHFANDKIMLGITDPDVHMMENNDGDTLAFVQNGSLYSYRNSVTRVARIYSFFDEENDDERTRFNEHDIRLLSVDEGGNIRFLIYGYMNRGRHEGTVCACVYYYDSGLNTIEEEVSVPYSGSYAFLKASLDLIAYADNANNFYMYMDGSIYRIRLGSTRVEEIFSDIEGEGLEVSESGATVAWTENENLPGLDTTYGMTGQGNAIRLFNLANGSSHMIQADSDSIDIPVGFIGEDFIYGVSDPMGIIKSAAGTTRLVMKSLYIVNPTGNVLKEYNVDGVYISDVSIEGKTISLSRIVINRETGTFTPAENDQIVSSGDRGDVNSTIVLVSTEELETIVEIQVIQNVKVSSLQLLTPKEVLFEGGRQVNTEKETDELRGWYVFAKGKIEGIYETEASSIIKADDSSGVVTDGAGNFIWKKTVRVNETRIKDITGDDLTGNDMADCLNAIMKYENKPFDTTQSLSSGESPINILKEGLEDKRVLNLEGCSLDEVLYYVSLGKPVLAPYNGNTMLITGYDSLNIVVLDPLQGGVHKIGLNDSRSLFSDRGNMFMTYVE